MLKMGITNLAPSLPALREHLLVAGAGQPTAPVPLPVTPVHQSSHHDNIDPAIAGPGFPMSGDTPDGHLSEGRKGRRELSTSKRAAQNRAAQVCRSQTFFFYQSESE